MMETTFAIVRHDGAVDIVEGVSVQDVAHRFGWPGDGTIEPFDPDVHKKVRHTFDTPELQRQKLTPEKKGD